MISELNQKVRDLKKIEWEEVYEKDNQRLEIAQPPFEEHIKYKEYRFMWVLKQIKLWEQKHQFIRNNIHILNIGTSSAVLEYHIIEEGYTNVTGLDVDDVTINRCRSRVHGATFIKGVVEKIPLENSTQDVVVCTQVLEHLVDPKAAIREMLRVLKDTGILLITVPKDNLLPSELHIHIFDLYKVVKLFKEFGDNFKVMDIHKYDKQRVHIAPNVYAVVYGKGGEHVW